MEESVETGITGSINCEVHQLATTYQPDVPIRKGAEPGFQLLSGENLVVARSIVITSMFAEGVKALGSNEITVSGAVAGTNGISGRDMDVNVSSSGLVSGESAGITGIGGYLQIKNLGFISGSYQGVAVYGEARIENSGVIENGARAGDFDSAVYLGTTHENTQIVNRGTIRATLDGSHAILSVAGDAFSDVVLNLGTIRGAVSLGNGNDIFDSATGRTLGPIDGGAGDDLIKGSLSNDVIVGGSGNDRLAGGKGCDVFEFGIGAGRDVVMDFDAVGGGKRQDYLSISEDMTFTLSDARRGKDTVLDFGSGQTLTLRDVPIEDFTRSDIHFDI
jgi:Ca2+-binding RTX toxin-like protein